MRNKYSMRITPDISLYGETKFIPKPLGFNRILGTKCVRSKRAKEDLYCEIHVITRA